MNSRNRELQGIIDSSSIGLKYLIYLIKRFATKNSGSVGLISRNAG